MNHRVVGAATQNLEPRTPVMLFGLESHASVGGCPGVTVEVLGRALRLQHRTLSTRLRATAPHRRQLMIVLMYSPTK